MEMKELVEDCLKNGYFTNIAKGTQWYNEKRKEISIKKRTKSEIHLTLPGKQKNKTYTVNFSKGKGDKTLNTQCNCREFKDTLDCKHCVAAALFITDDNHIDPDLKNIPAKQHFLKQIPPKSSSKSAETANSQLGYLFNFAEKKLIQFSLHPIIIKEKEGKQSIAKVTPIRNLSSEFQEMIPDQVKIVFDELRIEYILYNLLSGQNPELLAFLAKHTVLGDKQVERTKKYYHNKLLELWPFLQEQENIFILPKGKGLNVSNIEPAELSDSFPSLSFKVSSDEKYIYIHLIISVDREKITPSFRSPFFITQGSKYYLLKDYAHLELLHKFKSGFLKFPIKEQVAVLLKTVAPLQKHYEVEIDPKLTLERKTVEPEPQVVVAEYLNQFMMLIPQFVYGDSVVDYDDESAIVVYNDEETYIIERDKGAEKQFYEKLRLFHPSFSKQLLKPFYYLPFTDVMKGQWFLKTIRTLQDQNFTVKGMENLKKFRYNTSTPSWTIKTTSGLDWFDLKMTVTFGTQKALLRDIHKAIKSDQKVIVLGDGTLGELPEDWLERFGLLMKMGEEKNGSLRVNKMQFTLINELHFLIKEDNILQELEAKKQQLENIENFQAKPLSDKIKAQLRPYQLSGFQWMQALDEIGWGGCLADDMGLGKTLQVISFLQYVKETYPESVNLVVVPTSLIYNWENELQKFAPSLKYHIYYGTNRQVEEEHLENNDIILTSYGNMRNDIGELQKYTFQYVVLDESQSIKNPGALVTKAAKLLKARNRLILSGTPIQNNTFDLYAQMNFLNPGFLGNKDFFKAQFAIPIDKFGNREKAQQLRKMIYPFFLRRTKEKVASDLPDKTETILWCEMRSEQRKVYDDYKNYYRYQLLNKIDESGMNRSAIYILEGLMRLRQICDSPVLVKDEKVTTKESTKLDELLREVQENTGNRKVLIFSQFTEMLKLMEESFTRQNISHLYLDGKTPAVKRQGLVDQFQKDQNIKAFLISLKAGGVGLNLTAAEYVYLVDPWWNPAIETQAIDRTHRIGQTQKVFAYKMICKDSIEEKILQLQQKKKTLSDDLISEETSFVKKLTKEDVEFLFS